MPSPCRGPITTRRTGLLSTRVTQPTSLSTGRTPRVAPVPAAPDAGPMRTSVVVVLGASGGAGASTLAAAIAVRGRHAERPVVAVDLRPFGGGLDVSFGNEQEPGLRWDDLVGIDGGADGAAIIARLPRAEGVPVLSFGREALARPEVGVVAAVLTSLTESDRLVVIDASAESPYVEAALAVATIVLVVGGTGVGQLAGVCVVGQWAAQQCSHVMVCLRGSDPAGEVAELLESVTGLEVLACVADDRRTRADLVHGVAPGSRGRGPVAAVADACLARALHPTGARRGGPAGAA